jgi:hypothetical protein
MSIQQCYETFFASKQTASMSVNLNDFKVYSNLTRLGFICRRVGNVCDESRNQLTIENDKKTTVVQEKNPLKPLVSHSEHGILTKDQIFNRLNDYMPKSADTAFMTGLKSQLLQKHKEKLNKSNFKELFDVHLPNKNFKKSTKSASDSSNAPNYKLYTARKQSDDLSLPNTVDFILMAEHTNTSCLYAFANQSNGTDISYYKFNINQQLPSIY